MNTNKTFAWIAFVIFLMGTILVFVVANGAKVAQKVVFKEVAEKDIEDSTLNNALFELGKPAFNKKCNETTQADATINVYFEYNLVPSSCLVFVNKKLVNTLYDIQPDCKLECPNEKFSRPVNLPSLYTQNPHSIKVCCDGICLSTKLTCTQNT